MNEHDEDLAIARSVLRKLIYFDIFFHPLSLREIVTFCNYPNLKFDSVKRVIGFLEEKGLVNCQSGFYFLGNDASKIPARVEANKLATKRLKAAVRYARLVSNFPYVRAVFISGSLSKHVMKPDSDIDFFIVTEPGRLWSCRSFLTMFKKVFLGNSFRNFCINYFIDTESLEIPDKNIFTATEIVTLIPMYNYQLYREFMASNLWVRGEFPNCRERPENYHVKPIFVRKIMEYLLNNRLGEWFEKKSFSIITGYWEKKFSDWDRASYAHSFRSLPNVSKHHPNAFQEKVLRQYEERVTAFETITGFNLNITRKRTFAKQ